ncbi:MAG: AmmeMemoRadiSam system protein B, partial [Candidatus Aminicenantes bacterium]|nr:AmmeMemoRadiSam system protein B [Candidatus Aminicenantes bacterium]
MKKISCATAILALAAAGLGAGQDVQRSVAAGQYYPSDAAELSALVDVYLARAPARPAGADWPLALIAPHAGYIYSGPTAGRAYHLVRGGPYDIVVIIGPSHNYGFRGCSVYPKGGFETPLGVAAVDAEAAAAITRAGGFDFVREAYAKEHSVEVQVPFVQRALPDAKIVPIIMGDQDTETTKALAAALVKGLRGRRALVVASTDLSHYLTPNQAELRDRETVKLIKEFRTDVILRGMARGENIMCGGGPVAAALRYAQDLGPARVEVLERTDSQAGGGPAASVVGYLAAAIYRSGKTTDFFSLSSEEKEALLALAREAVTRYVSKREVIVPPSDRRSFLVPRAAFVTIRKRGELRGCIGYIEPVLPLGQTVVRVAIAAATEDTRFPVVTADELPNLEFEVSVLTPV